MGTPSGDVVEAYKNKMKPLLREKIEILVGKLEDNPDRLHMDITPAVLSLAKFDPTLIMPFLADAMLSDSEMARLHAQRALEQSLMRHFGFVPGKGWTTPKGEEVFAQVWRTNGNYSFDAPKPKREASVKKWLEYSIIVD